MDLHKTLLASKMSGKSNRNVDLSDYYTKSQTNDLLSEKVDKVSGKGLSTNDFTTALKTKLDGLENYDDTEMKKEIVKISEQTALNRSTLGYQRKNLLKLSAVPNNIQQVSWTPNGNGTITVNGTAYNNSDYYIAGDWHSSKNVTERGDFIVSCEGLVSGLKMIVLDYSDGTTKKSYSVDAGTEVRITGVQITGVYLQLSKDVKATNLVVKPMVRPAEITDDTYEPYKPSVEERLTALENAILGEN
ncbi:MAG: hypothetical protein K2J32_11800 [Ruminococcus sp.]|nr:hypothetical protein [Ruminococcus sp.]